MEKKPRKPQYTFLSRQMKSFVDHATVDGMLRLLDAGCDTEFGFLLGIIADLKTFGPLSKDHEAILKLPRILYGAVK